MRNGWLAALLLVGCYSPNLGSPGFFCHATDRPACPDGQSCVNDRCVDKTNVTIPPVADMAVSPTDGMMTSCKSAGAPCSNETECCSGSCSLLSGCVGGGTSCEQLAVACTQSTDCCSMYCGISGTCENPPSSCMQDNMQCFESTDCCSGFCGPNDGVCETKSATCVQTNKPCEEDANCCSGNCDSFDTFTCM